MRWQRNGREAISSGEGGNYKRDEGCENVKEFSAEETVKDKWRKCDASVP